MLQLRQRVSEKNANASDRQGEPTVQPLGGRLGSALGDIYPLGLCCEYRDPEAS